MLPVGSKFEGWTWKQNAAGWKFRDGNTVASQTCPVPPELWSGRTRTKRQKLSNDLTHRRQQD